ncbi:cysteine proteinase [Hymenopellis radicata]|nr:cysteine proteinase [Hymenopellis radicata]
MGIFSKKAQRNNKKKNQVSFGQQPEKAGRLVTGDLEQALSECKEKVARISKDCRATNRKFRDHEFDLFNDRERCLKGLESPENEELEPADVKRVTDLFDNPRFFVDGASSNDIVQGRLGDCWFVSALATMSTAEGLVEKFCVARDEKIGVYGFIFFRDSRWVTVIIDDLLYTSIPKFEELNAAERALYHNDKKRYNESARKGSKSLYFATSGTDGETWVPLIEKAYAKLYGSYGALSGGQASEAIEDLTGELFWKDELLKANQDRLFGVSFRGLDSTRSGIYNVTVSGLQGSHAYSVLRAVEVRGKKFVVVRNPWAQSEWNGPWSDGSKEWTKEWLEVLPELGHVFGDDGEFVMEYKDFLSCWQDIDRTLLFDSHWVMSSQWLRVFVRPVPSAWSFGDVSFTISVPEATPAVIVLSQLDGRYFDAISGRSLWTLEFVVFKKGEKHTFVESSSARLYTRSVNVEVNLDPGDYVVHVRLDRVLYRPLNYWNDAWAGRNLSRTLTERAKGQSLAMNFDAGTQNQYLPIPLDILAGQNLLELKEKAKVKAQQDGEVEDDGDDEEDKEADKKDKPDNEGESVKADEAKDVDDDGKDEKTDDDDDDADSDNVPPSDFTPSPPLNEEADAVTIGLRVYTATGAPVEICGQLRDGLDVTADLAL